MPFALGPAGARVRRAVRPENPSMRQCLAALVVTLCLAAFAGATRAEAAPTSQPAIDGSQVRLAAFLAPVRQADGRVGTMAVTPVLRLAAAGSAAVICDLSPRVLDAFISTLYGAPLAGYGGTGLNVDGARARLTEAVNAALGRVMVIGVDLVPAQPRPGALDARLVGAAMCKRNRK